MDAVKTKLGSFNRASDGAIGIVLALAASVLVATGGGAVDVWRKNVEEGKLQAAVDAGALAAAASLGKDSAREKAAIKTFRANYQTKNTKITEKVTFNSDGTIAMTASGTIPSSFLGVIGMTSLNVEAKAVVDRNRQDLELALVLDVSGSMSFPIDGQSRLSVMKSVTTELVDKLDAAASGASGVKVGIVPFNMTVNIGTKHASYVTGVNHPLFAGTSWAGCVMERPAPYTNSLDYDGNDSSDRGKWHAYISPPTPNSVTAGNCYNPSNGTNSGYAAVEGNSGSNLYKAVTSGPNFNCIRHPLLPLTDRLGDVRTKIDELTAEPNFGTIIAPGVGWANRLLSSVEPFRQARPAGPGVKKVMVVLTDGGQTTEGEFVYQDCNKQQNSVTPFSFDPASFKLKGNVLSTNGPFDQFSPYGFIRDSDPFGTSPSSWSDVTRDLANVSLDACKTAKDQGVEIFTIALSSDAGPGTGIYDLLSNCATDPEHMFYAADADGLKAAFDGIGELIANVRLIR